MTVTDKLLKVFRVDEQIEGLQTRLRAAERFLTGQSDQLAALEQDHASIESQIRQLKATSGNTQGEADGLQLRIDKLREQMNEAKTNKQYQAFLVEVNGLKADKDKLDTQTPEALERIDSLSAELAELEARIEDQKKIVVVAKQDRDAREAEIKDRLDELHAQRDALVSGVPGDALSVYTDRRERHEGDEVMAPVETQDFRRHEYICGSCMIGLPFESVMSLLSRGDLTRCSSCQVLLYLEPETAEKLTASVKR